jgi:hypothetical protein
MKHWLDALRVLVISGLCALAGALVVTYVLRIRHTAKIQMAWGAASATLLILGAVQSLASKMGAMYITWRVPVYAGAVICGFFSIRSGRRQ